MDSKELKQNASDRVDEERKGQLDLEAIGEEEGFVVDLNLIEKTDSRFQNLKLAPDGHTVLIPQPTDDPNDPLNWSKIKKHIILIVMSATAFLPDYGSSSGAVTLLPQSKIWGLSPDTINHSQAGNVFMLGVGGVFVVVLSAYFGRLPVMFWFTLTAVWTAVWCTAATTFDSFMAARILNGTFVTVAQGGGLMFIKDMFFFHEHARKINIWVSFIILSPSLGPMFSAFIISTQKWQWAFGLYTILTGLCLIGIVLFADETFYNRKIPQDQHLPPGSRIQRLIGTRQWKERHHRASFSEAVMRSVQVITRPTIFLSMIYYLFTFAWAIGINTTLAIFVTPLYGFGPDQIGYFYFAPVIATILGEVVGHWLHDMIADFLTRRNKGTFQPEFRLMVMWFSTPFMITGLAVLGFSLERAWHYMVTAVAWGLYVFGIMITTVGIQSYCLDSYPEAGGEVSAWLNFARVLGGFIISYFQVSWARAIGAEKTFAIQAGICAVVFFMVVFLQIYGVRLRHWAGRLDFKTD